ncbi:unnamed protein product [Adineta steineri]|uniref:K Homology domain-containing protein n=1 Tax=Adineta steineri TaxID=433720 RepID=A0A818ST58_9BILA|nr:unnamed protein product [Adineta steineri]CAF3677260.1 unnamed protein product [Adineta steineri]
MERATLKIEIPFTDHAHCIGRQGNQIQSIMSATDTHIHFPDGNREPNGTKSNQVSITGTITSIEHARQRIKDILPMTLKFLIPSNKFHHIINDDCSLFKTVRTRFNIIVLSRSYIKTGDVYCIVRGLINQSELVEATDYLIQAFYGSQASLTKVTCQIEVSEQYHIYLQTRQQSKDMCIESIEQYTHTTIQFPTININGYGRRTSVIITGSPAEVCQARKLFDLCLPIILTFEIPNEKEPTRAQIIYMRDKLNVTTIVRTRKDKYGKLITVQSQEYNSDQLFRVRSIILGLTEINDNNSLFDLNSTSTFSSDLSIPTTTCTSSSTILSTNHIVDSILIPIESCYVSPIEHTDTILLPENKMITTKKPSPIGHERSSIRNLDQNLINWSTTNDQLSSSQNNYSRELLTLLHSTNLEKYYSTSCNLNNSLSYIIDDITTNNSHFSFC